MAKSPTCALTLIAKNEEKNLPILLESVEGCFEDIYLTDTGSTDATVETFVRIGLEHSAKYGTVFHVLNFDWVQDFSEARNAALPLIKNDYWMWLDLDDKLDSKETFIDWKQNAMQFGNYFLANYHYAIDKDENPIISFIRERVVKNGLGYKFNYQVHEGIKPIDGVTRAQNCITWAVKHRRTKEDLEKDKGRNLAILENLSNKGTLESRLSFYYGKELFENGNSGEAVHVLKKAVVDVGMQPHDRIMAFQYLTLSLMTEAEKLKPEYENQKVDFINKAISIANQGKLLDPSRAEFWTMIGDCYLRTGRVSEAVPFYSAAKSLSGSEESVIAEGNHRIKDSYREYPRIQLARIFFNTGRVDRAEKEIDDCLELYPNYEDAKKLKEELVKLKPIITLGGKDKQKVPDIVISCPPYDLKEWDSRSYKTEKMGGSETAVIEMTQWLRRLTNRPVKVFNMRKEAYTDEVGVEYHPATTLNTYMSEFEPAIHIAQRHNIKLTNAPTYLWCHDLQTQGCEKVQNFDFMFCLSPFHKRYVNALQGVPKDKIILTRNGIKPERFKNKEFMKNKNKVVFPSSPDRGLAEAIYIVEKARKELPDLELHAYYGFENLRKCGLAPLADKLEDLIKDRPWVKYHGGVQQDVLVKEIGEAVVWLYPASFIESFCITALESVCCNTFPLVRDIGALPDTLREFSDKGMAKVLDRDVESESDQQFWADELVATIKEEAWTKIDVNPDNYGWQSVAKEWIKILEL